MVWVFFEEKSPAMKKALTGLLLFVSIFTVAQDIPFSETDYKGWTADERADNMFLLFEEAAPSDVNLLEILTKLYNENVLDLNVRNKSEKLSLFDACLLADLYMSARFLIEKGYKINQRCFQCNGETPLLKVVYRSGEMEDPNPELHDLMLFMIEKGADPDLRDMKGYTSLHWVIKNNDVEAFKVLMKPEVTLNAQLATLRGKGYLEFFDKHWNEDEYREILMTRTELKYPPTKKEIKERQKAAKQKEKAENELRSKKGQ